MRRTCTESLLTFLALLAYVSVSNVQAQDSSQQLQEALVFYASFDGSADADIGEDRQVYTAESTSRRSMEPGLHIEGVSIAANAGKYGDALRFNKVSPQVVLYRGSNVNYTESNWSGTVSMWMRLDPDKDLNPDYCDPLQITQRSWNDGAFFVDFDKGTSRDFRLGMFSNYRSWNPADIKWEELPVEQRPMVTVKRPPFSSDRWTHVAFTFSNINPVGEKKTESAFYLNGQLQGKLAHPQRVDWELDKTSIMLGINYIGDIDELAIFRRALTATEIEQLSSSLTSPLTKH